MKFYSVYNKTTNEYLGTYYGSQAIAFLPNLDEVPLNNILIREDKEESNALQCYMVWKLSK